MQRSALDWLLGFSDPELGIGWNPRASRTARWRLGRMRALLRLAGDPDRQMRVVLIAGTKGKGSTAAFLASILHTAGLQAGLFTSPHLQTYRERVRIDGAMLGDSDFARAIDRLRPLVARLRREDPAAGEPTTFELTLLLAIRAFADRGCAIAIIEVGLGGRLDATNALDPAVSVITSISYDHTAILGRTLGAIASEKAGIVRRGRPAPVAVQRPAAARAIERICRATGADRRVVRPLGVHADLALTGDHQRQNAALAIAAARALGADEDAIANGLRTATWPARFERVRGRPPIVLDGAHNGASAEALARTLRQERDGRRLILVVGINRDKDARAVIRPLAKMASAVVATRSSSPRAVDPADVARVAARGLRVPVTTAADVPAALAAARRAAGPDGLVCVAGSLALAADARTALGLTASERWW
ncbi:MAG TPA: folylpolyglutamate synthase/dihydrofolate synthase family protein [Candidatus Limnocylindria bacterium]|nr:folylpolyglutamate synthase/dihydrofolate synthase family protein [Candidatus Limnocylindria bacterium]